MREEVGFLILNPEPTRSRILNPEPYLIKDGVGFLILNPEHT